MKGFSFKTKAFKPRTIAYIALILNSLIWGLALPIVKLGFNQGLSPTFFLFSRFFLALLFSLPILFFILKSKSIRSQINLQNIATIIALELLGTFLALFLLYEGVAHTSAIASSLIAITWPIFVILGGIFIFKEKEEKNEWAGLILAITGTAVLVISPLFTNGFKVGGSTTGNLLIIGQNVAIAAYYLLAKKFYKNLNKWLVTHISFWVGTVSFGIVLFLQNGFTIPILTPISLIAILYMAILGSIVALTLYLIGQENIEASEASLFTYTQPLFALPFAIIFLGESISSIQILASILILTGVIVAEKR
jgi:drug/metabolite transporter (DMT)-like permease